MAIVLANIRKRRDAANERTRNCSLCGIFISGPPQAGQKCKKCEEKINHCVSCGDRTSEFLCPECLQSGARSCELCFRPAPPQGGFCPVCDIANKRGGPAQFPGAGDAPAAPSNVDQLMTPMLNGAPFQ